MQNVSRISMQMSRKWRISSLKNCIYTEWIVSSIQNCAPWIFKFKSLKSDLNLLENFFCVEHPYPQKLYQKKKKIIDINAFFKSTQIDEIYQEIIWMLFALSCYSVTSVTSLSCLLALRLLNNVILLRMSICSMHVSVYVCAILFWMKQDCFRWSHCANCEMQK